MHSCTSQHMYIRTLQARENYIYAKETYIYAKETYIYANETYIYAKETYIYAFVHVPHKDICTLKARENEKCAA